MMSDPTLPYGFHHANIVGHVMPTFSNFYSISHRTPFCQFGAEWEKGACKLGARRELTGSYKGLKLFLAAAKRSFGGR
jgi:hypothetical protein